MSRFADLRYVVGKAPKRSRWGKAKTCFWCGVSVSYTKDQRPTQATREHLLPRSMGGGYGENIAVACARCNHARRRDMTWVPFKEVPEAVRRVGRPMRKNNETLVYIFKLPGIPQPTLPREFR